MLLSLHDQTRCLVFTPCAVSKTQEAKSPGWEPRTLDMYCCTEQKVEFLSKHSLRLSSRAFIPKSLCASPARAAAVLLCRERIRARRGQKDRAQTKVCAHWSNEGEGDGGHAYWSIIRTYQSHEKAAHHQKKSCTALSAELKLWNMVFIWCGVSDAADRWVTELLLL